MRYVPRHLPNKLEYKVLSCISVHYQSRMTSNEIASTPRHVAEVKKPISSGGGVSIRVSKETFLPLNVQPVFSFWFSTKLTLF